MLQSVTCRFCDHACIQKGIQKNGAQKLKCKACGKYQLAQYTNRAWLAGTDELITTLVKEGCGIRSIARIIKISITTVIKRIKMIAAAIVKPMVPMNKRHELDEMRTFIRSKSNPYWVVYAIERKTKQIIDFNVGRRTIKTLQRVVDTLLLSKAEKIYTDQLPVYKTLIPAKEHSTRCYQTNHIERKNLTIRTHLKRLSRKTICFSKSVVMLSACLKIYFWSNIVTDAVPVKGSISL